MLEIKDLYKSYGKFNALNGLDFDIKKGECFGFVGPNGSGKTTTMKIIAGLLPADSGLILLDGVDARKNPGDVKSKIGYMPDFFGVYDNLKVIEYMDFYASIYGIVGEEAKKVILKLLDLVGLSEKGKSYVDSLSRGMKQRLCLARSMIHDPALLILDEPASGLDPRARYEMKLILNRIKDQGKTILISSHILPELAQMCSSMGIVERGRMVMTGTVEEILLAKGTLAPITIKLVGEVEPAIKILKRNKWVQNITIKGQNITLQLNGDDTRAAQLLADLVKYDVKVSSFAREDGNLETLFMQITDSEDIPEDEWNINGEQWNIGNEISSRYQNSDHKNQHSRKGGKGK